MSVKIDGPLPTRRLGRSGPEVSAIGLGCMVLSGMYGRPDPAESRAAFDRAAECGVTFLDTADLYSDGANETLLGELIAGRREQFVLASKFGLTRRSGQLEIDGRPEYARRCCDASLRRLGVDQLDLYYLHRPDPRVPLAETVGAMSELVTAGKVRFLGLCEVGPQQLREAHAVHQLTALQSEWSLWERGVEPEAVPLARKLGIGIVPFAPLGRGFLTGAIPAGTRFDPTDRRVDDPRLAGENLVRNQQLIAVLRRVAQARGATPAQIALAWLLAQGADVVPIPGAEKVTYVEENLAASRLSLSAAELAELAAGFPPGVVAGDAGATRLRQWR